MMPNSAPLETLGPVIEHDPLFPERVNVNVASVAGPDHLKLRGVGTRGRPYPWRAGPAPVRPPSQPSAAKLVRSPVRVSLPGGDLDIAWTEGGSILMTGPCNRGVSRHLRLGELRVNAPHIISLGCRMKTSPKANRCAPCWRTETGLVVVNSCAVTQEALRQTKKAIRRGAARIIPMHGCW